MATRFVNSSAQTAADQPHVDYCFLVSLDFTSAPTYVFNGLGQLTFNGHTYSGLGELGSISVIGESNDLKPLNPVQLSVSGVDPILLQYAESRSEYYGRSVRIDIAIFDTALQLLTPIENAVWEGTMDTVLIQRSEGLGSVTLTCESTLAAFNRNIGYLYSDEHQQSLYPGDTFYNTIADQKQINWGGRAVTVGQLGNGPKNAVPHPRP